MELQDQIVVYLDFLGTRDAIRSADRAPQLLDLLTRVSQTRGDFDLSVDRSISTKPVVAITIKPAISVFSDNVVLSIPLARVLDENTLDRTLGAFAALNKLQQFIGYFAAEALRTGFLLRGGATIDKLYHESGVVFGQAMVEAYEIESRTSVYPRIVVSPKLRDFLGGTTWPPPIPRDDDGLHYLDYFLYMLTTGGIVADGSFDEAKVKPWFDNVVGVIEKKMADLRAANKLNEFAKWFWFRRKWRASLVANPHLLERYGISLEAFPENAV